MISFGAPDKMTEREPKPRLHPFPSPHGRGFQALFTPEKCGDKSGTAWVSCFDREQIA